MKRLNKKTKLKIAKRALVLFETWHKKWDGSTHLFSYKECSEFICDNINQAIFDEFGHMDVEIEDAIPEFETLAQEWETKGLINRNREFKSWLNIGWWDDDRNYDSKKEFMLELINRLK